jgi:hypothetical protein
MTILEQAESIADAVTWKGTFTFDLSKPNGKRRKMMDVSRLAAMAGLRRRILKTASEKRIAGLLPTWQNRTTRGQDSASTGNNPAVNRWQRRARRLMQK